ncbi:acetyl/propionyl/methylcrotonyl-CoA carboxylase subunit alpha [Actinomadura macrotermitis]|uniref:Acetyl-/propionyl-coenzyme A carboxylase alpha chain n=1 Tax=Actinomadura macrotermitis TaxID=2585200 RepID=A0A7K0C6W2_9ACTN|nr:biotin carboxylase N-terminal domain-containing protein [Actinomadura macrotermitis]MQY09197.1 Acetyl-/propionyl-coenzyme A carboxylase alpha chain [Actinomadura macrotermitis]
MINKLLVANRGEIARRVFRTCRDLGIGTVAVYSDADEGAPHAREADAAVRLPGDAPGATYLRGDLIIAAARAAGADAIHPGYGFLSENDGFARAVQDAGLTWVGPPPAAITAMGSKIEAKKLMAAAGVPVLPELDPGSVTEADLPILVKASAGGGGRGMRVVRALADLPEEVAAARREAESAFGDPAVFCEPLLEDARHIEVQILADAHGTVWALGERDCSVQRRHQKIIEEAPSPAVDDALRAELCAAAVNAAEAIGYTGAGTVEFMLAGDGRFYFLEVNTRLQVEHPVTECVYGLDLVRLQIEVAEGHPLPAAPPAPRGHAIEVRLYAEDPAAGWLPGSGTLYTFEIPGVDTEFALGGESGLRLDSGVESGGEVGVHYDPMLAKLIAWAPTRAAAARRLRAALTGARLHGVTTNRDLLARIMAEPVFLAGDVHTGYLDRIGLDVLAAPLADEDTVRLSALAAALADAAANRAAAPVLGGLPSGWRNVPSQPQRKTYEGPGGTIEVAYRLTRDGLAAEGHDGVRLAAAAPEEVVLDVAGVRHRFTVRTAAGHRYVDSPLGPVALRAVPRFADPSDLVAPGSLLAPMPGTVVRVLAEPGAAVAEGQTLVVLEAMKMEHRIAAPAAGTVAELNVSAGQQVEAGAVLAVISEGNPQ